jgi:hypothetical protein
MTNSPHLTLYPGWMALWPLGAGDKMNDIRNLAHVRGSRHIYLCGKIQLDLIKCKAVDSTSPYLVKIFIDWREGQFAGTLSLSYQRLCVRTVRILCHAELIVRRVLRSKIQKGNHHEIVVSFHYEQPQVLSPQLRSVGG